MGSVKSISDFAKLVSRVDHPHKPLKFITALPEGYETSDDEDVDPEDQPRRTGSLCDHEVLLGGDSAEEHDGVGFSSTDDAEYEVRKLYVKGGGVSLKTVGGQ